MASTYSTSLRLELMATGDQSGTWGDTTNTNLGTLLEQSITGYLSKAMADTNQTLTNLDGASDEARNMIVEATGALTAGRNMVVPTAEKLYLIKNSTTGGFAVTVKTSAGTGVAVAAGTAQWVYCDGTNVVQGLSGTLAAQAASAVAITGGTITGLTSLTLASGAATPATNDAAALGTTALMWSDLFLASGGVINWNNGALTLTQATETLTQTFTDAGATVGPVYDLYRDSSTPAVNDILGRVAFNGEDSAGNKQEYASIEAVISDPTSTSEDGTLDIYTTVAGTRTLTASFGPGVTGAVIATQAQMETATSLTAIVTPGRQHFHPSAAKVWLKCNDAGAIAASYNVTSIADTGTGLVDISFATAFSSANYAIVATNNDGTNAFQVRVTNVSGQAAGGCTLKTVNTAALIDPVAWFMAAFGDL